LRQAYGVTVHARKIERTKLGSFFEPVIGKPGDGASPHCAINDEYHEQQTDEMADTMLTGMGAREQPLMLDTTTAGNSLASPCYAHQKELEALLENSMQDDSLFGLIYTIDKDDDWSSEMALQKANPNMGISVTEEFLYAQQEAAIRNARHQNRFKTKHLDVWVTAREVFINIADWNRQTDTQLCEEMFEGEECWVGMDLSSKKDVTAVVKLFKRTINGDDHYYVITPKFYLPENTVNLPECEYYQGWVHDGFLNATHGNIIDFVQIREDIIALKEQFSIASVAYDPWGATQLAQELQDGHDIEVIEVPQKTAFLSEPMKWLDALVTDGRLHHDGNPVLTWMIGNLTARKDANDNVFPRKEDDKSKNDGAVALIMALGRAMHKEHENIITYRSGDMYGKDAHADQQTIA
jgi:phage terminase large subunit-like protein